MLSATHPAQTIPCKIKTNASVDQSGGVASLCAYYLEHWCTVAGNGISFNKHSLKHCSGNTVGSSYSSLSAAEAACRTNSHCTGVYDSNCDNRGSFYLCNSAALQTSSGSCVYTKSNGASMHTHARKRSPDT